MSWRLRETSDMQKHICATAHESAKLALSLSSRVDEKDWMFAEAPMFAEMVTKYRALAARLNCMANDRADLTYDGMVASTGIAKPSMVIWRRMMKIGGYPLGSTRVVAIFKSNVSRTQTREEIHSVGDQ